MSYRSNIKFCTTHMYLLGLGNAGAGDVGLVRCLELLRHSLVPKRLTVATVQGAHKKKQKQDAQNEHTFVIRPMRFFGTGASAPKLFQWPASALTTE